MMVSGPSGDLTVMRLAVMTVAPSISPQSHEGHEDRKAMGFPCADLNSCPSEEIRVSPRRKPGSIFQRPVFMDPGFRRGDTKEQNLRIFAVNLLGTPHRQRLTQAGRRRDRQRAGDATADIGRRLSVGLRLAGGGMLPGQTF